MTKVTFAVLFVAACTQPPLPTGTPTPQTYFTAQATDTRFYVADHFLAAVEMQLSGEPFAQLIGRNLAAYDRFNPTPNLYLNADGTVVNDPIGWAMAIESYEYSKQPMNNTSFESGAGLSLQFAPNLNPAQVTGDPAFALLRDRLQQFATESSSGGPAGSNWVISPAPGAANPLNVYGWPGYWPVFAEFESFQPDITPSAASVRGCSITAGYAGAAAGPQLVGDYECGYNSLNLAARDAQVTKVLSPAAMGFAAWKQGLWSITYWGSMHDNAGNPITNIATADLPQVGQPNNTVVGQYDDGTGNLVDGVPGVYLGDIPLEGWQGLTMMEELDNKAAFLLSQLMTTDGTTLQGFPSVAQAIAYDYTSPLRWWPAETTVTETAGTPPAAGDSWQYFPQPTALAIMTPTSRLQDLTGVFGGFSELFALTDSVNADIGGQSSTLATFDGDPFAADNGLPDGEDSPHDRALAILKIAAINADRIHYDAANNVLVDEATISGGQVTRGHVVTTATAAYSIVGLRTAWRSISSQLVLYSNDTPDTHGGTTRLDAAPLAGAPAPLPDRMVALLTAQADFIADKLVGADGLVANSYDLSTGMADTSPSTLLSQAAAIRGLLDAYLATSNEKYRQSAIVAYGALESAFYMDDVRAYRTVANDSSTLTYAPANFGALHGALRQYWKLVAQAPGSERLANEILERVKRNVKLILNGWDDANGDDLVQFPSECTGASMQMGERALTGELAQPQDNGDRDHDCVMEISLARKPSALAGQVVITRR